MSERGIAKELGVSPALLSLWGKGKRKLSPELQARYYQLVNTRTVNVYKEDDSQRPPKGANMRDSNGAGCLVGRGGFEPSTRGLKVRCSAKLSYRPTRYATAILAGDARRRC